MYLSGQPGEQIFAESYARALNGAPDPVEMTARSDAYLIPALKRAKTRATRQGVPFSLTLNGVKDMLNRQGWKCAVSGIAFPASRTTTRPEHAFRPSIDRIEPKLGYVESNVRVVCEIVNLAMNNWGEDPLWRLVRQMRKVGLSR